MKQGANLGLWAESMWFPAIFLEPMLKNNSCLLAAWARGIFNRQKLGVWALLFPRFDLLLGGFSGIVGIIVWLALGWWQVNKPRWGRAATTNGRSIRPESQSAS